MKPSMITYRALRFFRGAVAAGLTCRDEAGRRLPSPSRISYRSSARSQTAGNSGHASCQH